MNRSYFPGIVLSTFDEQRKQSIENEIAADLTAALAGIRELPRSCRKGVYLAYTYYSELLKELRAVPAKEMMEKRIRVSNPRKAWLTLKALIRLRFNSIRPPFVND